MTALPRRTLLRLFLAAPFAGVAGWLGKSAISRDKLCQSPFQTDSPGPETWMPLKRCARTVPPTCSLHFEARNFQPDDFRRKRGGLDRLKA
jgi:hypothetical protein